MPCTADAETVPAAGPWTQAPSELQGVGTRDGQSQASQLPADGCARGAAGARGHPGSQARPPSRLVNGLPAALWEQPGAAAALAGSVPAVGSVPRVVAQPSASPVGAALCESAPAASGAPGMLPLPSASIACEPAAVGAPGVVLQPLASPARAPVGAVGSEGDGGAALGPSAQPAAGASSGEPVVDAQAVLESGDVSIGGTPVSQPHGTQRQTFPGAFSPATSLAWMALREQVRRGLSTGAPRSAGGAAQQPVAPQATGASPNPYPTQSGPLEHRPGASVGAVPAVRAAAPGLGLGSAPAAALLAVGSAGALPAGVAGAEGGQRFALAAQRAPDGDSAALAATGPPHKHPQL